MKGHAKKLKRQERQNELLKNFEGDFYQEKKVGNEWLIKMWNGGTKKWQVAVFSDSSYKKYKMFGNAKKEEEELNEEFENKIATEPYIPKGLEKFKI
jgi:hypothetical protein